MELGRDFSAENFNEYVYELATFIDKMIIAGMDESAKECLVDIPTVSWHTPPSEFKDIFDCVENALYTIDAKLYEGQFWRNDFSVPLFTYKKKNGSLYPYVKRWFDWLNYNNNQYDSRFGNYEPLYTIENGVEEQAFDINNEAIEVMVVRS